MSPGYLYRVGDRQAGPVTEAQLRDLVAAGRIPPGTHVWREGMSAWVRADRVPGLLDPGASAAGPAPAPEQNPSGPLGSVPEALKHPAVLAGGGCVLTGLLMACLLGLVLSCGGCLGGGRYPSRLVGEWVTSQQMFGVRGDFVLELRSDGRFAYRSSVDLGGGIGDKTSGTWKVERVVDGNYKVQVVFDTEPDRTYGWIIVPVADDKIRPEGNMFPAALDGKHLTFTRKK